MKILFFFQLIQVGILLPTTSKRQPQGLNKPPFLENFILPKFYDHGYLNKFMPYEDSQYFFSISIHRQDWESSVKTCRANGENWDLLSIDSQAKAKAVFDFLEYEGVTRSEFWTSGRYESSSDTKFVWGNGSPLPPWAPFAKLPPPNRNDRVTYFMETAKNPYWSRKKNTGQSRQSICEYTHSDVPVICYARNDLIVALDSSGSIGAKNYQIALTFVAKLMAAWKESSENRLGFALFSNNVENIFSLNENSSAVEIHNKVMAAPYRAGGTATEKVLGDLYQQFSKHVRSVPRNSLLITDGQSNRPTDTIKAAEKLKSLGIRMFAVGVGNYNPNELTAIAGGNNNHVFTTQQFSELLLLLNPVSSEVCRTIPK